jgi:hypothetical protein
MLTIAYNGLRIKEVAEGNLGPAFYPLLDEVVAFFIFR